MAFLVVKMVGALALLVFVMIMLSESLQKMSGPHLRHTLSAMTSNRFAGVFTGMLITVAVQSSSATTVMTVSFVNAQLLSLGQAISVIMGANIGTTLKSLLARVVLSGTLTSRTMERVFPKTSFRASLNASSPLTRGAVNLLVVQDWDWPLSRMPSCFMEVWYRPRMPHQEVW